MHQLEIEITFILINPFDNYVTSTFMVWEEAFGPRRDLWRICSKGVFECNEVHFTSKYTLLRSTLYLLWRKNTICIKIGEITLLEYCCLLTISRSSNCSKYTPVYVWPLLQLSSLPQFFLLLRFLELLPTWLVSVPLLFEVSLLPLLSFFELPLLPWPQIRKDISGVILDLEVFAGITVPIDGTAITQDWSRHESLK